METDAEGGLVEPCVAHRIAELDDREQGTGREVWKDARLSSGFWEGQEDELARVCGGHGVTVWHRDYNGIDGDFFVHVGVAGLM